MIEWEEVEEGLWGSIAILESDVKTLREKMEAAKILGLEKSKGEEFAEATWSKIFFEADIDLRKPSSHR